MLIAASMAIRWQYEPSDETSWPYNPTTDLTKTAITTSTRKNKWVCEYGNCYTRLKYISKNLYEYKYYRLNNSMFLKRKPNWNEWRTADDRIKVSYSDALPLISILKSFLKRFSTKVIRSFFLVSDCLSSCTSLWSTCVFSFGSKESWIDIVKSIWLQEPSGHHLGVNMIMYKNYILFLNDQNIAIAHSFVHIVFVSFEVTCLVIRYSFVHRLWKVCHSSLNWPHLIVECRL